MIDLTGDGDVSFPEARVLHGGGHTLMSYGFVASARVNGIRYERSVQTTSSSASSSMIQCLYCPRKFKTVQGLLFDDV